MNANIRQRKRFINFKKAINQLTEFIEKPELNKFEVQGLIHCYKYTLELAWKTSKDYLEQEGFEIKSPQSVMQKAFQVQLIKDGHIWIDAMEKRNLLAHTYDENVTREVVKLIRTAYYPMLKSLYAELELVKKHKSRLP